MRYPPSAPPIVTALVAALLLGLYLFPGLAPRRRRPPVVLPPGFAPDGSRFAPLAPKAPAARPAASDTVRLLTEQSREVSPGLLVLVRGMPGSDNPAAVPRRILTIARNGRVIYTDTTADYLHRDPAEPEMRLCPLWVPAGPGRGELLVRVASPPGFDFVRRFVVTGQRVVCRDTLPAFDAPARNLDQDPALELSGYRYSGEQWEANGRQWTTYNPCLYYEVRPTGLVLDSALTRQKALAQYGVFRGFRYADQPGILQKTQPGPPAR